MSAPFTSTLKVQELPPVNVAPERLMLFDPGTAVIVPASQDPIKPLSSGITISPDGSVSVNAIPAREIGLGFVMVKLKRVIPENNWTSESANDFVNFGGCGTNRLEDVDAGR